MEQKHNSKQGTTSLVDINFDCLRYIFELLEFGDLISLAETCTTFANVTDSIFRKKFKDFTFNRRLDGLSNKAIDRIVYHIMPYVTTLRLEVYDNVEYVLSRVDEDNEKLKNIVISTHWFGNNTSLKPLKHVKCLKLDYCNLGKNENFFTNFCNLKTLTMVSCGFNMNLFENNETITSLFIHIDGNHQLDALPLNLERLCFYKHNVNLNALLKLNRLKSLKLLGGIPGSMINRNTRLGGKNILIELGKKGILEELAILEYILDENTFGIFESFKSLHVLALKMGEIFEWKPSLVFPPNLKHLKLGLIQFSTSDIVKLIDQLTFLKDIHITKSCPIVDPYGTIIKEDKQICQQIFNAVTIITGDKRHMVNVYIYSKLSPKVQIIV